MSSAPGEIRGFLFICPIGGTGRHASLRKRILGIRLPHRVLADVVKQVNTEVLKTSASAWKFNSSHLHLENKLLMGVASPAKGMDRNGCGSCPLFSAYGKIASGLASGLEHHDTRFKTWGLDTSSFRYGTYIRAMRTDCKSEPRSFEYYTSHVNVYYHEARDGVFCITIALLMVGYSRHDEQTL